MNFIHDEGERHRSLVFEYSNIKWKIQSRAVVSAVSRSTDLDDCKRAFARLLERWLN